MKASIAHNLLEYHRGLHLKDSVLWLDPPHPQPMAFVSHALSPGALDHHKVLCTEPTARLLTALTEVYGRGRRAHQPRALVSPYGRTIKLGQLTLELIPSGYTLGAASLRVQYRDVTTLYTGPIRVDPGPFCPPLQARPCQLLVLPGPLNDEPNPPTPRATLERDLTRWVADTVADDRIAVLLCSPVGEAQEVARLVTELGCPVVAHRQIAAIHRVFRGDVPSLAPVARLPLPPAPGSVVLWPCRLHRSPTLGRLGPHRTALASAAALDPETRATVAADTVFPLDVGADRSGLLELVQACAPEEVVLWGGRGARLQRDLQDLGIPTTRLGPPRQLALF